MQAELNSLRLVVDNHEMIANDELVVFGPHQIHVGVAIRQGDEILLFVDPKFRPNRAPWPAPAAGLPLKHVMLRAEVFTIEDKQAAAAAIAEAFPAAQQPIQSEYIGFMAVLGKDSLWTHDEHGDRQFVGCEGSVAIVVHQRELQDGIARPVID